MFIRFKPAFEDPRHYQYHSRDRVACKLVCIGSTFVFSRNPCQLALLDSVMLFSCTMQLTLEVTGKVSEQRMYHCARSISEKECECKPTRKASLTKNPIWKCEEDRYRNQGSFGPPFDDL